MILKIRKREPAQVGIAENQKALMSGSFAEERQDIKNKTSTSLPVFLLILIQG
jgi:hypothetical protein